MIVSRNSVLAMKPMNQAASQLPAKIEEIANRQIVTDMTASPNPNPSITPINPGRVANVKKIAPKYTITVENTTGGGLDCYLFNLDTYTANNGGVTVTYSDGFAGKLLNKLAADQDGLLFFGFNITGYDSAGDPSDDVVNSLLLELRSYIGYGASYVPTPIDISGAERNTQFKTGLFTVKTQFIMNCLEQLKMTLGAGEKATFVLFTQPIQD
mgnify:CR=1 FL=1